jgi:hypothetical protein
MFGIKKQPQFLTIAEIYDIVSSYLLPKLPGVFEMIKEEASDEKIKILASTPQWTLVQILDNYFISLQGTKFYDKLLQIQTSINKNSLPSNMPKKDAYLPIFFEFCLSLRGYDPYTEGQILNQAKNIFESDAEDTEKLINATRLIQEYELKNHNPNYTASSEEDANIEKQLADNAELYNYYRAKRPEVLKLLN